MIIGILLKNKKAIGLILGLILLAILVWKFWPSTKLPQADVPDDKPNGQATEAEKVKANETARALFTDMDGFAWNRNFEVYKDFAALSDTIFVLVYNRFNELYAKEDEGTLREWLDSELYGNQMFRAIIHKVIVPRMDRLNLI